jgi:predicted transcriptional regulator
MLDLSKVFKNAVINLYTKGVYTVDYAIIEASKLADKNKINATDYEELITYLAEEQAKSMQKVEEKTEENIENAEENVEDVEDVESTNETSAETTEEVVE